MFRIEDIPLMALEFADAHTKFIEEIDRIASKYGIPCEEAREMAFEVHKEVDLDDTDNG